MENVKNAETYYTAKEAAEILKINLSTVYQLVREGRLRAARIGKRSIRSHHKTYR